MPRNKLPKISIIIPVIPKGDIGQALKAIKKVDYPQKLIEIIIARGFSPSRQRNEAAKKAKGEILYFLDDDSEIHEQTLKRAVAAFKGEVLGGPYRIRGFSILPAFACRFIERTFFKSAPKNGEIVAVGGPNVWEGKETFWAAICGIIQESFFGSLKMCARFRPIGKFRRANERELVLCNMAIKRTAFLEFGGFREELYPNEECELMNRMIKQGYDVIYHPGIFVFRPRREKLKQIIKTFLTYGSGRMEQVRLEGFQWCYPLFLPLILLFYIVFLIFYHPWWALLPLLFYFGLGFSSAIGFAVRRKKIYLVGFLPIFFLVAHLAYAIGSLRGIFTNLEEKKRRAKAKALFLEKFKVFDQSFPKINRVGK